MAVGNVYETRLVPESSPVEPAANVGFTLFSGTERVEWGSGYYLEHPVRPLPVARAVVNVASIGRNLPDSLAVIGGGQSQFAAAAARAGLTVVNDPWPALHLLGAADHGRFRPKGIPVLYLCNGQHAKLHRPGDEVSHVRPAQVAHVGRFLADL